MKTQNVLAAAILVFLSTSVYASLAGEGGTPAGPTIHSGAPMSTVIGGTPAGPLLNNNVQPNIPAPVRVHRHRTTYDYDNDNTFTETTTFGPYIEDGE
jgi:hypothetical protein